MAKIVDAVFRFNCSECSPLLLISKSLVKVIPSQIVLCKEQLIIHHTHIIGIPYLEDLVV